MFTKVSRRLSGRAVGWLHPVRGQDDRKRCAESPHRQCRPGMARRSPLVSVCGQPGERL